MSPWHQRSSVGSAGPPRPVAVREHHRGFHLRLRGCDLLEPKGEPGLEFGLPRFQTFGSDPRGYEVLWEEPSEVESCFKHFLLRDPTRDLYLDAVFGFSRFVW